MLLQFCALGVMMSWDDGFLGARASHPHNEGSWERGRPARTKPGTASVIYSTWINRERRHGSPSTWPMRFPPTGWLQHRTEAQRRPKGQNAGGTPALPGNAVPAVPWGVSGGRLLRMPTCTLWKTPVCPRAGPPPCRADHSRKNSRSFMKTNHQWTRINTNRPEDRWTSLNDKRYRNASAIWCPWCDDAMG